MVNKFEFSRVLQNPANLTLADNVLLSETIQEYPFFQTAKAIELKALKIQNSHLYNQKLKVVAAHTVDRSVLFDFITSKKFHTIENTEVEKEAHTTDNSTSLNSVQATPKIEKDSIKMTQQEASRIVDPALFEVKKSINSVNDIVDKEAEAEKKSTVELDVDAPLNFNKNEKHSFSEWLKLTSLKPIERENKIVKKSKPKLIESPLIESFIKTNPKISPVKSSSPKVDLSSNNMQVPNDLMTETLAKVYLAQHNYKKAIQAYKILSLKNPEKSGLFADRIRSIEKLQQNK